MDATWLLAIDSLVFGFCTGAKLTGLLSQMSNDRFWFYASRKIDPVCWQENLHIEPVLYSFD
jgi:hypothetical protein